MSEAKVSILDRAFCLQTAFTRSQAVLDGKLIDNALHLARLERSVGEIALALPETTDRIQEIQRELVVRNNLVKRMVLSGGDARRPIPAAISRFPKGVKPTLVMFPRSRTSSTHRRPRPAIGVITVP